jgi:uncharacterized protein
MHFVISCKDKTDHLNVRMENRPDHVDYLKTHREKIVAAGPTLGDTPEQMTGSLLIMEFDSLAEAETWAENDPYAKAGLFDSTTITPWKNVIPG